MTTTVTPPSEGQKEPPAPGRRSWLVPSILGFVVLAVAVAIGVVWLAGSDDDTTSAGDDNQFTHVYELNGSLDDANGGPALVATGGTVGPEGFVFEPGDGLAADIDLGDSYTMEFRVRIDQSGHAIKLFDFSDLATDGGLYVFEGAFLRESIATLSPDNAQGQLYLTDVVELAAQRGTVVDMRGDMSDLTGVNDQRDLALASAARRRVIAEELARSGVAITDLDTLYVDVSCEIEPGASLGANVHLRGRCTIAAGAHIDTGCVLTNVVVEADAKVLAYTVATDSTIGREAQVGPFTHLRPQSVLGPRSKVGNFSETKQTTLGEGSKVNHLSYVGNGEIGRGVNIGAGTIFCNYDGEQKHTTTLEDNVFVGSDTQFVAPVTVKKGAYVASGTTVTRDVPEDALAVSRTKQENKEGYAARLRARLRNKKKS